MLRALRTAASGMMAQQLHIDLVAHNLANVNTTGFKRNRADFEDLLYQTLRPAGPTVGGDTEAPASLQVGHGVKLVSAAKVYSQGDSEVTGNPLDLAIQGDGFFQIRMPDGSTAYTRDGTLRLDSDGRLVTPSGLPLEPEITVPTEAMSVMIDAEGRVFVRTDPDEQEPSELGQILLARFINPSGLEAVGGNILRLGGTSGDATVGAPGELGLGFIRQGALERSNVEVVQEMINMIVAQRAFEINSKAVRTAEELLSIVNNLKR